jgi:hypothetical protein
LNVAERVLCKTLLAIPDAAIRWPTFEELEEEWTQRVLAKSGIVVGRWGFIDGKNYKVQTDDLQNALFNGWLHAHLITGTLCFGADGIIVWAKLNCPGTWGDADMSLECQE